MSWRACERLAVRPSGVKEDWDDCSIWTQAKIIAFGQIRDYEHFEELKAGQGL